MKIEELLTRYFEGETSREEESELRSFFANGREIPEELQMYRSFFTFLDEEAKQYKANKANTTQVRSKRSIRNYFIYSMSGVAAALLLILGIAGINKHFNSSTENYVIIDGKKYTDVRLAREQAQAAFADVSFSKEDIFDTLFNEE